MYIIFWVRLLLRTSLSSIMNHFRWMTTFPHVKIGLLQCLPDITTISTRSGSFYHLLGVACCNERRCINEYKPHNAGVTYGYVVLKTRSLLCSKLNKRNFVPDSGGCSPEKETVKSFRTENRRMTELRLRMNIFYNLKLAPQQCNSTAKSPLAYPQLTIYHPDWRQFAMWRISHTNELKLPVHPRSELREQCCRYVRKRHCALSPMSLGCKLKCFQLRSLQQRARVPRPLVIVFTFWLQLSYLLSYSTFSALPASIDIICRYCILSHWISAINRKE